MQRRAHRFVLACAATAALLSAESHAQIGPFPRAGLTRITGWSAGSTLTVGSLEAGTEAISLTFSHDAAVGAVISSIGHRRTRPDGTVARWDYPASPPTGQPRGMWQALLRPIDEMTPFDVTPDSATAFEVWVDSAASPQRALFAWSGLTIPGRNPEHRFTMEAQLTISPAQPARAAWDSRMIRIASTGNEQFTIDEVIVPIVYVQQPAAQAGLARILVPVATTLQIPATNLSMALWSALGLNPRVEHPARGQQMQFSALHSCDSSIEVPLAGGDVLSPYHKILYFATEDTEGHFKRFEHRVVRDPATGVLSYRWAPVYYPAYGASKRFNIFVSPYPAILCALQAQNDSFWFDVTSHYRAFVRNEMGLTPIRDASYALNPDIVRGSVFFPTTNLPAFLPDLADVYRTYVDAAIDLKQVFLDPATGAPSPVFMQWQKWLNGDASVGEDPFGANPVPFTGTPDAFREPPQPALDEIARAQANGINMSVYTNPLIIDNDTWTSFPDAWYMRTRLGEKRPAAFGFLVDHGNFGAPLWFEWVFFTGIMQSAPGLGGFYLDTVGGLGSFLRYPLPGASPFAGFQYNGGTRYISGVKRMIEGTRRAVGRFVQGAQHPYIPLVTTEAVQEFYAGLYDFAQHGYKTLPMQTQLSTVLDQLSGVFVPAPVGASDPHPPLWNAVYHEFSRADALGVMLSTRAVAAFLGGGQAFDPAKPAVTGLTWPQWRDYNCMVHALLFAQGMKPTVLPYFYDAKDVNLLVRDSTGQVDVRNPAQAEQTQLVAYLQRLHESTARHDEAGQFLDFGVQERPLSLPPLPPPPAPTLPPVYSPLLVTTVFNPSVDVVVRTDNLPALTRSFYEDTFSSFPFYVPAVFHSMWRADPASNALGLVFVNWSNQPANWSATFDPSLYAGLGDDFVVKGLRPSGGGVQEYVVGSGSGTTDFVWNAAPAAGALALQHHGAAGPGAMPPRSVQVFLIEPN